MAHSIPDSSQYPDTEYEEGDICPNYGHTCWGFLKVTVDGCSCHTLSMPPCSSCEHPYLECSDCGYAIHQE